MEVDESEVWNPLRSYQSKLEKLAQRIATEQASAAKKAAAAARVQEDQWQEQQGDKQDDVEMDTAGDEQLENAPEKINGKKRQAEDIDDEDDRDGEMAAVEGEDGEGTSDAENVILERERQSRDGSVSGNTQDGPTVKETKRIRVN